jgi:2-dehydropantoate 2-reductase
MRFVICGAGAIGSTIGGYLALKDHPVVLVARPAHASAIQEKGLTLKTAGGELRPDLQAVTDVSELEWTDHDIIFMTSKSQNTRTLLDGLSGAPKQTPLFCFQNGVRNEEWAAESFDRVYGGLVVFSVNYLEPGAIEHTRNDVIAIGKFPEGLDDVTTRVGEALSEAGFRVTLDEAVMPPKWGKMLLNLNNAVYALVDTWLQLAYTEPKSRRFLAETMREGLAVIRALGIESQMGPGEPDVPEFIEQLEGGGFGSPDAADLAPSRRTYPSTWQDVVMGRAGTEVEHFNGEIVKLGQQSGIPTPYNSTLLEMMGELSERRLQPGAFSLNDIQQRVQEKIDEPRP